MKKFLSLVLALVMTMSLVTISAGAKDFTDNSKIAYKEAVDVLSAVKVIDGYTDGSFNPSATLTRGAAAKIICNLILGPTTASALSADAAPFKDVPADSTFAGYIAYCSKAGIISGYADGTFKPGATLTSYAYMKMLLGALGYDAEVEGYTGNNWSINVAKQALAIGLDKGLSDDFNGIKAVTREEACLYALNTLKATMVEYDAKTTVSVGGAEVVIAGSKAKPVYWDEGTKNDGNIGDEDGFVQFAEKYFSKLTLADDSTDAFSRPSNIWRYKSEKVGTYPKTPAKVYHKNVKLGDIYADLDMTEKDDPAVVYIDGVRAEDVVVSKANDVKVASDYANKNLVGDGSTVEVYYDDTHNNVTICVINTYAGTVAKSVEAKGNAEAYILIDDEGSKVTPVVGKAYNDKFETTAEFEDDTVILFTYSDKDNAIKSVEAAESVEGSLSLKTATKSFELGGTTYKHAINMAYEAGLNEAGMNTKSEYVLYLDKEGNAIYVTEKNFVSDDYALVLATEASGSGTFASNRVKLLTTAGVEKVYPTDKNYTSIPNGSIVTFKVDADGTATLRTVPAGTQTLTAGTSVTNLLVKNGKSLVMLADADNDGIIDAGDKYVYSNSKTVFVVKDKDGDYKVYTGTNSAPDISDAAGSYAYAYCKTTDLATVIFVLGDTNIVVSNSNDITFLAGESMSKNITDVDNNVYNTFNAVVDGKITKVKVDASTTYTVANRADDSANKTSTKVNYLYSGASYDKDEIITSFDGFTGATAALSHKGTIKLSGEYTIGLGTNAAAPDVRYTVAESAKIFKINTDGDITEVALSSIKTDADDTVLYTVKDGQITNLFVQEVTVGVNEIANNNNVPTNLTVSFNGTSAKVAWTGDTAPAEATIVSAIEAKLKGLGFNGVTTTKSFVGTTLVYNFQPYALVNGVKIPSGAAYTYNTVADLTHMVTVSVVSGTSTTTVSVASTTTLDDLGMTKYVKVTKADKTVSYVETANLATTAVVDGATYEDGYAALKGSKGIVYGKPGETITAADAAAAFTGKYIAASNGATSATAITAQVYPLAGNTTDNSAKDGYYKLTWTPVGGTATDYYCQAGYEFSTNNSDFIELNGVVVPTNASKKVKMPEQDSTAKENMVEITLVTTALNATGMTVSTPAGLTANANNTKVYAQAGRTFSVTLTLDNWTATSTKKIVTFKANAGSGSDIGVVAAQSAIIASNPANPIVQATGKLTAKADITYTGVYTITFTADGTTASNNQITATLA